MGQLLASVLQLHSEFFEPARHLHRPSVVAEVSANLAHHGRHSERYELVTVVDVEPVDGVEQTNSRHLDQVLERLTAVSEPPSDVVGQRQAALNDRISVPLTLDRIRFDCRQTAKHIRDIRVFGSSL